MCRQYKDYIRACAVTHHKGERIPLAVAEWNAKHTHILFGKVAQVQAKIRIDQWHCRKCGGRLNSGGLCVNCWRYMWDATQPAPPTSEVQ